MATPSLNTTTVIVDDNNPSIVYSGTWVKGGTANEFDGTTHGSLVSGSTLEFKFSGTSVAVYGTMGVGGSRSSYSVDASTPVIFTTDPSKTPTYQQPFFKSPTLTDGEHTLLVTDVGTGELWIDYILYVQSAPQPDSPSSSSDSSSPPPSTPPLTSPTLTPHTATTSKPNTNSPTPEQPSNTTSPGLDVPGQTSPNTREGKSSIPPSALVGGAIGALVLIIVLVFAMLYYRKRAKRLAGAKLLKKEDVLGDSPEFGKSDPGVVVTPFTSGYTPSPLIYSGNGSSTTKMYPTGPVYPLPGHDHPNQSQPSTPIYHFSNYDAPQSGYNTHPDHIVPAGPGIGYRGSQYEYANSVDRSSYLHNPHSQYGGIQQDTHASSDELVAPQRRGSLESGESHTSLAYMSVGRPALDPSSPLPDTVPAPPPTQIQPLYQSQTQVTPRRTGKGSFIVHNGSTAELHQHEDSGMRLDVQQPQGTGSQQPQVIDIPPAYNPNY